MAKSNVGEAPKRDAWLGFKKIVWRCYISIATAAIIVCVTGLIANHWGWLGVNWSNSVVDGAWSDVSGGLTWLIQNAGEIVRVISFGLLALALFKAAMNIETVFNIVRSFNDARSPIAELRTSVDGIKTTARELGERLNGLRDASDTLNRHAPTLSELNERLAAISEQVIRLQEETVSQRMDGGGVPISDSSVPIDGQARNDANWEELRAIWGKNNERLESIIRTKLAGPRQRAYDRLPRTNYPAIIDRLKQHNVLSIAGHTASLELHRIFMGYKPRNRSIPDQVIADMRILDAQLDQEIGRSPIDGGSPGDATLPEALESENR